jgi:feruloyl esterase
VKWNGKFLGTGNGAFAGAIRYNQLIGGLKHGYAVVNTDMGTFPAGMIGGAGYAAGTGHPDVIADWGWRATHEMTVFGRAMAERYYGRKPPEILFSGCSTGGQQALTEAQRFPGDYDAILAGAPGHNRAHLHLMFLQTFMDAHATAASFVPQSKVPLVTKALLSACVGKDGGALGDTYLTDPSVCKWSPRELLCKPGADTTQCLTTEQVRTFEEIYRGGINRRTGHIFYPGWPKGSEDIFTRMSRDADSKAGAADTLVAWTFGSDYDARKFDFDRDMDTMRCGVRPSMP